MSYKLILRQEAERDLAGTYNWYNEMVPGLGSDFLAVVERALESIQENPTRFPSTGNNSVTEQVSNALDFCWKSMPA